MSRAVALRSPKAQSPLPVEGRGGEAGGIHVPAGVPPLRRGTLSCSQLSTQQGLEADLRNNPVLHVDGGFISLSALSRAFQDLLCDARVSDGARELRVCHLPTAREGALTLGRWEDALAARRVRAAHDAASFCRRRGSVSSSLLMTGKSPQNARGGGNKLGLFVNVTQKSWILFHNWFLPKESRSPFSLSVLQFSSDRKISAL